MPRGVIDPQQTPPLIKILYVRETDFDGRIGS